jgi:ComF family protein
MVYNWINNIQFWLFPATCLLCKAPGTSKRDLCSGCYGDLPHNTNACRSCAIPLGPEGSLICGHCQTHPPPFERALAPFRYEPLVDVLVRDLKFRSHLPTARLLGELLCEHTEKHCTSAPDGIVPVPLHPTRLRERGFNQALELARPIARRWHVPILANRVYRARVTAPQSQLDLKTRLTNVRGAFAVKRPIQARHVAIIDDVVTTGSTVAEMARVLRAAGVETVQVWSVARTTPSGLGVNRDAGSTA